MNLDEYKKIMEKDLIKKLERAEKQIKNNEITKAEKVFSDMRAKYCY